MEKAYLEKGAAATVEMTVRVAVLEKVVMV